MIKGSKTGWLWSRWPVQIQAVPVLPDVENPSYRVFCKHQGIFQTGHFNRTLSSLFMAIIRWFLLGWSGKHSPRPFRRSNTQLMLLLCNFQPASRTHRGFPRSHLWPPVCLPGPGHALQCTGRQPQGPGRGGSLLQRWSRKAVCWSPWDRSRQLRSRLLCKEAVDERLQRGELILFK